MVAPRLIVHAGGSVVSREDVEKSATPRGMTPTHYPLPHSRVLALVEKGLDHLGYDVASQEHALSHGGNRYFGLMELRPRQTLFDGNGEKDYSLVMGLRNSHDQTFPAGYAVGSRVFVCDNLAFMGEVQIARKHTRWIGRDLPQLVGSALGKIHGLRVKQDTRIATYRRTDVTDAQAHDIVIRAMDAGVMASNKVQVVCQEWRNPRHEDFRPRTAWSLMNAFTETLKKYDVQSIPERTQPLYALMDAACGIVVNN